MAHSILVVDDDPHIRDVVRFAFEKTGMAISIAQDGKEALRQFDRNVHDLIVLDIGMPEMDGLEVCRQIRKTSDTPILFLSARDEEIDRVLGLEIGGDDYVTKPFSPRELMARVKAHLRRGDEVVTQEASPDLLRLGPFTLDRAAHRLSLRDQELALTSTEFRLLEFFLTHPGRAYSREQLLEEVWGQQHYVSPRTVDVHVRRLRERIEEQADAPQYLATVRGFGYRFEAPQ